MPKMPRKPYYGELNVGETSPNQSAKKKPKKIIKPKPAVITASLGKKIGGGAKSAIKKRREIEKSLLMN